MSGYGNEQYGQPQGYGPPPQYGPPGHGAPYGPPSSWPVFPPPLWPHGPGRPGVATAASVMGFVTGGLTIVVTLMLLAAVLALLGRSAWWLPRWLDRILPDLDVEGARLGDTRPVAAVREPVATAH